MWQTREYSRWRASMLLWKINDIIIDDDGRDCVMTNNSDIIVSNYWCYCIDVNSNRKYCNDENIVVLLWSGIEAKIDIEGDIPSDQYWVLCDIIIEISMLVVLLVFWSEILEIW